MNRATAPILVINTLALFAFAGAQVKNTEDHGRLGKWIHRSTFTRGLENESGDADAQPSGASGSGNPQSSVSRVVGTGGIKVVTWAGHRSVQVNVDSGGRNIVGDAANEPTIAINPLNPNEISVGFRWFRTVSDSFRQAGIAYSSDAGATWKFPGSVAPDQFRSDPVLGADNTGAIHYLNIGVGNFEGETFESVDGGKDWANLGYAEGGDKEWLGVDRSNSIGSGNLYEFWNPYYGTDPDFGWSEFTRSSDGGNSWIWPVQISGAPVWGTIDVSNTGDVYVAGLSDFSYTWEDFLFAVSHDAKDPSNPSPTFSVTPVDLGGAQVYGAFLNPDGLLGQTWIASDKSNGPNAGSIYILNSVAVDENNPCDVHIVKSTDGGQTWGAPIRVNKDPLNTGAFHWFGTLSVAPNGRIDVCWYDNRSAPSQTMSALYHSSSFDGGVTWTPDEQLTPTFDSTVGWPQQQKIGDYMGMISDNSGFSIAYSATFNNEEDVWFLRVPVSGHA